MRSAERLFAALLLLTAGALVREASRLPVAWTATGPGSGFFPFVLAVGVGFNAFLVLARSLRSTPAGQGGPFMPPGAWWPLLAVFLPIAAVVALIDYLGIYLGGAFYLAGYTWFVGRHRWLTIVLVSALVPLALFLIFERWFMMPMPKGLVLEYLLYGR